MRRIKLSYVLFCLAFFALFFVLMFPYQNLRGYIFGKIYAATNILIVADDIYPSLLGWPGIGIKNVNITLPVGRSELELASEKVIFKVSLGQFFPPAPAVSLNLKRLKGGGDLYIKFMQSGPVIKVSLEADRVGLDQLSFSGAGEPMKGSLNSESKLSINQSDLTQSTGHLSLEGSGIKTASQTIQMSDSYSFLIPEMHIGTLKTVINISGGTVDFTEFRLGDNNSDLSGNVTGDIKLGRDYGSSKLNIVVKVRLSDKIMQNPQARTFTAFLAGFQTSPGNYGMKWNANISDFTQFSINALPQRIN